MRSLFACLVLTLALSAACSADRPVNAPLSGSEAGSDAPAIPAESGIVVQDTRITDAEEALEIDVQPANTTVTYDLAQSPARAATQRFSARLDGVDVTASSVFTIDDETLGAFTGPVFSSTVPLPLTAPGRTLIVTARTGGKLGRAKLTLVRLRATGDQTDFLFYAPQGVMPSPAKLILSVYASAAAGGSGSEVRVVLRNDQDNPPGVDARKLVEIRAMGEGNPKMPPPVCAPQQTKDGDGDGVPETFVAGAADRSLCFEIVPRPNVTIPSGDGAAFHRVFVDVTTSTGKVLESRSVVVIVPATDPIPR